MITIPGSTKRRSFGLPTGTRTLMRGSLRRECLAGGMVTNTGENEVWTSRNDRISGGSMGIGWFRA
jgi:hypothetical protein